MGRAAARARSSESVLLGATRRDRAAARSSSPAPPRRSRVRRPGAAEVTRVRRSDAAGDACCSSCRQGARRPQGAVLELRGAAGRPARARDRLRRARLARAPGRPRRPPRRRAGGSSAGGAGSEASPTGCARRSRRALASGRSGERRALVAGDRARRGRGASTELLATPSAPPASTTCSRCPGRTSASSRSGVLVVAYAARRAAAVGQCSRSRRSSPTCSPSAGSRPSCGPASRAASPRSPGSRLASARPLARAGRSGRSCCSRGRRASLLEPGLPALVRGGRGDLPRRAAAARGCTRGTRCHGGSSSSSGISAACGAATAPILLAPVRHRPALDGARERPRRARDARCCSGWDCWLRVVAPVLRRRPSRSRGSPGWCACVDRVLRAARRVAPVRADVVPGRRSSRSRRWRVAVVVRPALPRVPAPASAYRSGAPSRARRSSAGGRSTGPRRVVAAGRASRHVPRRRPGRRRSCSRRRAGAVLVDQGPPEADVAGQLATLGVRSLSALVLTHPQRDHVGGAAGRPAHGSTWASCSTRGSRREREDEAAALAAAREQGVPVRVVRSGDELRVGGLRLERALARRARHRRHDPNDHAIVLLARLRRSRRAPHRGRGVGRHRAPAACARVEVLKVAHHGSADPGLARQLARPPSRGSRSSPSGRATTTATHERRRSTALRCVSRGCAVFRTDEDGRVVVEIGRPIGWSSVRRVEYGRSDGRAARPQGRLPDHRERPTEDRDARSRACARHFDDGRDRARLCPRGDRCRRRRACATRAGSSATRASSSSTEVDGRRNDDNRLASGWKAADIEAVTAISGIPLPTRCSRSSPRRCSKDAALAKAVAKAGQVLGYDVAKRERPQWVADAVQEAGCRRSPTRAPLSCTSSARATRSALANEIDKLATWAEGEPIGAREVESLVAATAETPTFALTDAWAARDAADAARRRARRSSSARTSRAGTRPPASPPRSASHVDEAARPRSASRRRASERRLMGALGTRIRSTRTSSTPGRGFSDDELRRRHRPARGARPRAQGRQPPRAGARAAAGARSTSAERPGPATAIAASWRPATRRAACDFLRAAVFLCSAPCDAALSIERTSARCSAATASASPSATAVSEALRQRLDRRAVAEVLEPLPARDPHALLLLLDVRHDVRAPAPAGSRDGSRALTRGLRALGRRVTGSYTRRAMDEPGHGRRPRPARRRSSRPRRASRACSASCARWSPRTTSASTGKINAFTVAFQIPNLVRALVADAALSGAFVPVFSELLEKGDRKRAWRVASTIFWLVLLVLGRADGAVHPARPAADAAVRRSRRTTSTSPSGCRASSSRSSCCSARRASSSGSSTRTTTSRSLR